MEIKQRPKVGMGVYILNPQNQILLLLENRKDSSGKTWSPPGGHLEFGEEFMDCVKRETKEEINLDVLDAELWAINNNIRLPDSHYVNLDFLVKEYKGEPKIMEPEKCEKFGWFDLNNLPRPLLTAPDSFLKTTLPAFAAAVKNLTLAMENLKDVKIVCVCGPTASGKDTVLDMSEKKLSQEFGQGIAKAEYFKTRKPRDNEKLNSYFISEQDFDQKVSSGEMPEWLIGKVGNYRVGYNLQEFSKANIVLVNIDDKKARSLKQFIEQNGGKCLNVFVHAPEETRVRRFMQRESWLFEEPARYRIENDVTEASPESYSDFDLIIENKDGELEKSVEALTNKIKEFVSK